MNPTVTVPAPLLLLFLATACGPATEDPVPDPGSDPSPAAEQSYSFESLEVDRAPPGFTAFEGDWRVQPDPEGGGNVLAQLAASAGPVFNLVLADRAAAADLELSTRVFAVSGETDRGGGLVWRAQDGRNYYICRWNPLESNFRLYKVIEGNRIQLASAAATAGGGWHEIHMTMVGNRIECRLDGEALLQAEDGDVTAPGRVGLWTKADAVTLFDGLRATGR